MSLFGRLSIFCAGCAREIDGLTCWTESMSKTKVCGKECHDKVEKAYFRAIMNKTPQDEKGNQKEAR